MRSSSWPDPLDIQGPTGWPGRAAPPVESLGACGLSVAVDDSLDVRILVVRPAGATFPRNHCRVAISGETDSIKAYLELRGVIRRRFPKPALNFRRAASRTSHECDGSIIRPLQEHFEHVKFLSTTRPSIQDHHNAPGPSQPVGRRSVFSRAVPAVTIQSEPLPACPKCLRLRPSCDRGCFVVCPET